MKPRHAHYWHDTGYILCILGNNEETDKDIEEHFVTIHCKFM